MSLKLNVSNSLRSIALVSVLVATASNAFAHTTLLSATPAVNATLSTQPGKLVLNFGEPVMLMGLKLVDNQQKSIGLNFKVTSDLKKSYEIALPTLQDSTYTVNWVTMGKDGHNMSGKYNFTLKHVK